MTQFVTGTTVQSARSRTVALTSKLWCGGTSSVAPAGLVARTENVCGPLARGTLWWGDEHGCQSPASIRHSKVEPEMVVAKEKVGSRTHVRVGGPSRICVRGVGSRRKLRLTTGTSTLPDA